MGILRVDVIDAKALHGADRSGKSDVSVREHLIRPHLLMDDFIEAICGLFFERHEGIQIGNQKKVRMQCEFSLQPSAHGHWIEPFTPYGMRASRPWFLLA